MSPRIPQPFSATRKKPGHVNRFSVAGHNARVAAEKQQKAADAAAWLEGVKARRVAK